MEHLSLRIEGMSCGHCVRAVTRALEAMVGVDVVKAEIGLAEVVFDPSQTGLDRIAESIREEGYEVIGTVRAP